MAMMDGWSGYDGGGWIALVLVLVFIAVAAAALVAATGRGRAPTHTPASHPGGTDPEADRILQRRFAAGEIDEDEYLQRRSLLHDRY
jgi:putative membrane protein